MHKNKLENTERETTKICLKKSATFKRKGVRYEVKCGVPSCKDLEALAIKEFVICFNIIIVLSNKNLFLLIKFA